MKKLRAFSLVELLVVIAIISVLAAMLLPSLDQALFETRITACMNNHKQIQMAAMAYTIDNKDLYPFPGAGNTGLWSAPPVMSQYYNATRGHEYYGYGLLWRLNYLQDRQTVIDPEWNNPAGASGVFMTYCVSKNGIVNWTPLNPPVGIYPPQRASTWTSGCYVQYYHEISGTQKPRRATKKHVYTKAVLMCEVLGYSYPNHGAHRKQVVNATYDDGHVRRLETVSIFTSLGSRTDYSFNVTGNENHFAWWPWASNMDK